MHDMVSRSAKHVFSQYLRKLPLLDVPACVSHLLNCLVGYKVNSHPYPHVSDDEETSPAARPEWAKQHATSIHEQVAKEAFKRYRYRLEGHWWNECKCIVLLREVCLKMGLQLRARDYTFEKKQPVTNGLKLKKFANGTNGHEEEHTFYPDDVLNVVPIIKDAPLKVTSH